MLLLFSSIVLLVGILYNTVLQSPQITEVEYQNNIAKTEKVKTDNIDEIIKGILINLIIYILVDLLVHIVENFHQS